MNRTTFLSFALLPLALVVGCGSTDPGATPDAVSCQKLGEGPLLPWKVGNRWTYQVTQNGQVTQKITTIEVAEPVGGSGPNAAKMAYKVVTKKGVNDETISWQGPEGDRIVRYREQSFAAQTGLLELEEHWEPPKLHVDGTAEHKVAMALWVETFKETRLRVDAAPVTVTTMDVWRVLAECEVVQVLGKSYDAIKLTKVSPLKTYWYVPGVGKVKESGEQIEELVKFEAVP